jgi:hypothetical protein
VIDNFISRHGGSLSESGAKGRQCGQGRRRRSRWRGSKRPSPPA